MSHKNLHHHVRSVIWRLLNPLAVVMMATFGIPAAQAVDFPLPGSLHRVTLTWDSDPFSDIESYRVLIGLQSQQYIQEFDTGSETSFPIEYLEYGQTYYFAVKAIGTNGLASPLSQELVVTIAPPALPLDGRLTLSQDSGGPPSLRWNYPQASAGSVSEFVIYSSPDLVHWTKFDTVDSGDAVGGDAQTLEYAWPIVTSAPKQFFRVTAKNWMSESMTP